MLPLLFAGCVSTIQGYTLRPPRAHELQQVARALDPLLITAGLPSIETISTSKHCKIGFAIVETDRVNVWSAPAKASPCLYFSLFLTEGALRAPEDEVMAMIAHELGHVILQHTPLRDTSSLIVSVGAWEDIQAQELAADRFAVSLLKRARALSPVASCESMARLLLRSGPDWYGTEMSPLMDQAVTRRVDAAAAACAAPDLAGHLP